jgi:glyoxylase-like metal-dependent hydrolase (beta-lactamase superfamily II)
MKIHTFDLQFKNQAQSIAAFLVVGKNGIVLVETGPHSTLPHLEAAIESKGFKLTDIQHVFLSHIHFDHAGAAWAFARNGAKIYVHPRGLPHLANPEKLYNSARQIYQGEMDKLWGEMHPIPTEQLYAPADGESIEAAGLRFTAWYTPGHASHHIAWEAVTPRSRCKPVIFAGDIAGVKIGKGPVVPPCPPPDINIEEWLQSLEILRKLPVETLYLTHFGKQTDKNALLDELGTRLLTWSAWMKYHFEKQTPLPEIVPLFQAFVVQELRNAGVSEKWVSKYEAANPAFMAVAGLMRYWAKK